MKPRIGWILLGAWVVVSAESSVAQQPQVPPQVTLALPDQFEKVQDVAQYRGHVTILLYGDRSALDTNREVGKALHVFYHPTAQGQPPAQAAKAPVRPIPGMPADAFHPDVIIVPVACTGKVPAAVRSLVRSQVKKAMPEVPVWLDFEDKMKTDFGLVAGTPNMIILDSWGRMRARISGKFDEPGFAKVTAIIDRLRIEAAQAVVRR